MPRKRFPLAGSLTHRGVKPTILHTTDQKFTNCFPEVIANPITKKSTLQLVKRQGVAAQFSTVQASASASYGACIWTGHTDPGPPAIFSFLKSTGSSMMFFDSTGSQVGSDIANTNSCVYLTETLISGTANLTAALVDSGTSAIELWYFPQGGAWTQNTDGDLPSNIQPIHCHMDGYQFFITRAGAIWNTDLNSLSAVTAINFINAQSMPDQGVGVARYRNTVAAFGDKSLEFFQNAGNATGSPLSRIDGSMRSVGALRPGSSNYQTIMPFGETVYWIGVDAYSGRHGIYRLNNFNPEKISTPFIDRLIAVGAINIINGVATMYGMRHIAFETDSGGTLLMYCIDTGFWWYLAFGSAVSTPKGFVGVGPIRDESYFADGANIYKFDAGSPVWQDASTTYTMTVQTGQSDEGTHARKFYQSLALIGDTQSSASAVTVKKSDDDYGTTDTLGTIDMNASQRFLTGLGSSRRRAWILEHSANTPCRLEALEYEYTEGQR